MYGPVYGKDWHKVKQVWSYLKVETDTSICNKRWLFRYRLTTQLSHHNPPFFEFFPSEQLC